MRTLIKNQKLRLFGDSLRIKMQLFGSEHLPLTLLLGGFYVASGNKMWNQSST
jgi:hypothetical protein